MDGSKFVILGGGMVAGYAAKLLVKLGLKPGELTILSADNSVPYERPPLSKGFRPARIAKRLSGSILKIFIGSTESS